MKRTMLFTCIILLTLGVACSFAKAGWGISQGPVQVSPPTHIQPLADFDVSPEINALRAAKQTHDNAIKNCNGNIAVEMAKIDQNYEKEKQSILYNAYLRRRNQLKEVRVHVSCLCYAHAIQPYCGVGGELKRGLLGHRYIFKCKSGDLLTEELVNWLISHGFGDEVVRYTADGEARIDCPQSGLQVVNGSGRFVEIASHKCEANCRVDNPRCENNGYTIYMKILDATKNDRWMTIQLEADFAYDDAKLTELAQKDYEVLKARILQSL